MSAAELDEARDAVHAGIAAGGGLLVHRGVQYLFVFLGGLVVARALGPDARAEYALPLNLATLCWVGFHLSIEAVAARLLGRSEESYERVARLCSLATIVLGLAGGGAALALGLALRRSALADASVAIIVLAAATVPFMLAAQLGSALLLRRGRVRFYGRVTAAAAVLQLVLIVGVTGISGLTPELTLVANLVTLAITAAVIVGEVARELGPASLVPAVPRAMSARAMRLGLALHPSSIALFLNLRIDLLLVGAMLSAHEAGLYSLSTVLGELVFAGAYTFSLAALQAQTDLADEAAIRYTLDFIRQTFALTILLLAIGAVSAYPFITIAYGSAWTGSVVPFMLLSLAAVGLAIEGPARGLLIRMGRPRDISVAAIAATILNVALNVVLIPRIGISGAAISSICSYWFAAAAMLFILHRSTGAPIRTALGRPRADDLLPTLLRRYLGRPRCAG